MKKIVFLLLSLSFLAAANAQTFTGNSLDYLNYLNQQHNKFANENLTYIQYAVHSDDVQEVEKKRIDVGVELIKAIVKVNGYPAYEGDDAMRQELLVVLETYAESFKIEFNEINILKSKSQESFEAMQAYFDAQDAVEKKLAKASKRYIQAQEDFAKKNNITLLEDEKDSQVERMNQVNDYYRVIFMKYFKITKLNGIFTDALEASDAKEMEKARKILLSTVKIELKKLEALPAFNGNKNYRNAAINLVKFYQTMAEGRYKSLGAVIAKDQSDYTQKDVDTYNSTIELLNTKSSELMDKYNNEMNELLRSNIPKPKEVRKGKQI